MDKIKGKQRFVYGTCAIMSGLILFLVSGTLGADNSIKVENSIFSLPVNSQYRQYLRFQGEVMLPARGYWRAVRTDAPGNTRELYLVPSRPVRGEQVGHRLAAVIEKEQVEKGQYFLQSLYWPCSEYAKEHNQSGPTSWQDLDGQKYDYLLKNLSRSPWGEIDGRVVEGPFVFLVPEARFNFEKTGQYVLPDNKEVLAWELRPFVDDGMHWVLYTDGSCLRQPIDDQRIKKYGQAVRPVTVKPGEKEKIAKMPGYHSYTIAAVYDGKPGSPLLVTVENTYSGETLEIAWDLPNARPADADKPVDLKEMRLATWFSYAGLSPAPVLTTWMSILDKKKTGLGNAAFRNRQQETLSAFDILGGRAAVRETLQLQVLDSNISRDEKPTIAIDSLSGVNVESHPFREMLEKSLKKEEAFPLASLVPHDRFMVYMANPRDILAFLDKGCDFLDRLGTSFTGNGLDYGLDKKYVQRLGLNRQLLANLFKLGGLAECILIFPDLFFIDGTDITVVSRLAKPALLSSLLKLAGIEQLPRKSIFRHQPGKENTVYWCRWDDLLMISTSESELEKVLQLKTAGGKGSLGQSDEFRYMLTQLPVTSSTWGYVYLSDPFIRRLVGPAVKIGQLRRIKARAEMEFLTAAALLAQLDGLDNPRSMKNLVDNQYIPAHYQESDYTFDQNQVLYSRTYGSLANLEPLSRVRIDRVTPGEENAYKRYVEVYSDYWRKYFDPIALRLDEREDGFLEAEVFILPLVDNTIYNGLKEILKKKEDNTPLKIPKLSANPVFLLSLNLEEPAWQGIVRDSYEFLARYISIPAGMMEDLGPGLHLAVHDADPVIALGSGDILGLFDTDFNEGPGRLSGGMFSLPVILSILTRPCTLIIETQNPQKTLGYLKRAAPFAGMSNPREEFEVRVHQVEDRDQWVFSFNLLGLVKLRFGVHLQGEFLFIRNIPWSHHEKVIAVDKSGMSSAALETYPESCNLQLPGLFEADQDRNLHTAFQGVGHLYPLLASGYAGLEDAAAKHAELLGFAPRHPGNGRYIWDRLRLKSSTYGEVFNQRQPAYQEGDTDFGVLKGFQYLGVSMQFEDTGLRTKFRWKMSRD